MIKSIFKTGVNTFKTGLKLTHDAAAALEVVTNQIALESAKKGDEVLEKAEREEQARLKNKMDTMVARKAEGEEFL